MRARRLVPETVEEPMNRRALLRAAALPILMRTIGAPEALATATGGNRRAALDGFLRQQVEQQRVIGITAQIVQRDGEIVYAGIAGQRDPSANEPIRPDMTLFRLASMTKPITAVAVLMLVEANRITLDDPVSRFLANLLSRSPATTRKGRERCAS